MEDELINNGMSPENARRWVEESKEAIPEGYTLIATRHFDALAEGLAEIKATNDGHSDQPISEIIEWILSEIEASKPPIF